MGKTQWRPAPYKGKARWLCTDGSVLTSPIVETTPSQRRWRIQGTEISVPSYDLPGEIDGYMRRVAMAQGKTAWMELTEDESTDLTMHRRAFDGQHNGIQFDEPPTFKVATRSTTAIAFEFIGTEYPELRAILWVSMAIDGNGNCAVGCAVTYRSSNPDDGHDHTVQRFADKTGWKGGSGNTVKGITWPLDTERFGSNPRKAASRFAELLRWATDVDTIGLPDHRERHKAGLLEYKFTRTNYSPDLYRQLLGIVQSGPSMERLREHLVGIQKELANLGIVVSNKEGFNLTDLLAGKLSEFQVQMYPQETDDGDNGGIDQAHRVHLDLGRGIFVVSCDRHDLEEVAEQWNVAKFKAELTGEVPVMLAFAQAYNDQGERNRLQKIVRERKVTPPRNA
jgi:hypothetical protein